MDSDKNDFKPTYAVPNEITMDSDKDDFKPTYAVLNEMSNKIVSFPELKKCIEENFLCKQCLVTPGLSGINASTLSVWQDTYGIATVLKISCGNHHMVEIIPECLNNEAPRHSTKKFVLNYKLLIIMQLLGKELKTISIITALLGMHVALGNYKIWKELLGRLGTR